MFELVNKMAFGEFEIGIVYYVNFFIWYAPIFIIQACLGVSIYRKMLTASVYYFTRLNFRMKWWLKECFFLYLKLLLCILGELFFLSMIKILGGEFNVDFIGIKLALCYVCIFSTWSFVVSCLINILSIYIGSYIAFVIVALFQFACLVSYLPLKDTLFQNMFILKINPLSHLIFYWHGGSYAYWKASANYITNTFYFSESLVYMGLLTGTLIIIGLFVIKKKDYFSYYYEGGIWL